MSMEDAKNALAIMAYGNKREIGKCVKCGSTKMNSTDFRDAISFKESKISFLCQVDQDEFFGEDI